MDIKRITNKEYNKKEIKDISEFFDLPEFAVVTLFNRGLTTRDEISEFLNPDITKLNDPFLLTDMQVSVDMIKESIKNNETIVVYGDYDVDGISAVTIIYKYFKSINADIKYFIPSRTDDGYGLNVETLRGVLDKFNPQLLITVDCGISCYKEVDFLLENNVKCIVTDHHDIPENLPKCPILDAKLENQKYPFKDLCGAGMAYKLVCALSNETPKEYLPIVALATISDIVPLQKENRILTTYGLKYWEEYAPYGIKKLAENLGLENLSSHEISFKIAPRINAPGRLGSPIDALNLYLEKNENIINDIIVNINDINIKRQEYCTNIIDDVNEMLKNVDLTKTYAIILENDKWEAGVVGIACSRIAEEYNRPTFLFSKVDGIYKGSGRTFGSINISELIRLDSDLLIQFGGHSAAVGIMVDPKNFDKFVKSVNNNIKLKYDMSVFTPIKYYDEKIDINDLTISNFNKLARLEPFGFGNKRPLFYIDLKKDAIKKFIPVKNHLAIRYNKLNAIGFNMLNALKLIRNCEKTSLLVDMDIDEYNKKKRVKGIIKAYNCTGLTYSSSYYDEFLYILENYENKFEDSKNNYKIINDSNINNELESIKNEPFGTAILFSTIKGYKRYLKYKDIIHANNIEYNIVSTRALINSVVVCPEIESISQYKNIIVLDDVISKSYFNALTQDDKNLYYFESTKLNSAVSILKTDRKTFAQYYTIIKNLLNKKAMYNNYVDMYFSLQKLNPNFKTISFMQFAFCIKVFTQLDIIQEKKIDNMVNITLTKNTSDLNNSYLYQNILKER